LYILLALGATFKIYFGNHRPWLLDCCSIAGGVRMLRLALFALVSAGTLLAQEADSRLKNATEVFSEMTGMPDKGIPQDLLDKAQCVIVIPGLKKAAIGIGAQYGRGFVTCRKPSEGWGAPAAVKMEGGSVGLQLGAQSTDVVMLVMNKRGMEKLLSDKFTIGVDASAAAGPVGRNARADTDATMHAEILSWSRSRGAFAGVSLQGATLRPDKDENQKLYGRAISNPEILEGKLDPPPSARGLVAALNKVSMRGTEQADRPVKK
jgi:SH3 domain-containing YSC84-like protein 1